MCLEVDVISVHWERTLKSKFLKDSKNHIYQDSGGCRLRHKIEFHQFSESLQTTWAAAANHGQGLHFWEMCCKTPCRADLLVGVTVCSMTGTHLVFSSMSHQESMEDEANGAVDTHIASLPGRHLAFFSFGFSEYRILSAPLPCSSEEKKKNNQESLTLLLLVVQLCVWVMDPQRSPKVALTSSTAEYSILLGT